MDFHADQSFSAYQMQTNEGYMNAEQLEHFKTVLLAWKASITEKNQVAKQHLQNDTSPMADMNDRASLEEELSLTLRSRDRERKLINKINAALERIASDDFGYCEKCGVEIGVPRLEARPTAELCIDCKEIEEKKEKSRR